MNGELVGTNSALIQYTPRNQADDVDIINLDIVPEAST